jgi:micrococcal nuclease
VRLVRIVYNPDGDDVMQGERVEIRNPGSVAVEMTSWVLSDEATNRYVFPSFTLPGGATATVWTKAGTDNGTDLYWGRTQAVWNNDGDIATLTTGNGIAVDICVYIGGGSEIGCE